MQWKLQSWIAATAILGVVLQLSFLSSANAAWTEVQQIPGGSGDGLGNEVSMDGNTMFVGAQSGNQVFVYENQGGTWNETQVLTPSDSGSKFGKSLDVTGDRAIIADPGSGQVYVFDKTGGTWSETQILTGTGSGFLLSAAIDGDRAIVGAPFANGNQGAVVVFDNSGGTWSQSASVPSPIGAVQYWGYDVAFDGGNTFFAGAPFDSGPAGSVSVMQNVLGTWSESQRFDGNKNYGEYGRSIAYDDDTLVVGATRENNTGGTRTGRVHVYDRVGGNFSLTQTLEASVVADPLDFGRNVAIDGDVIAVGDEFDGTVGRAYIFENQGGTWTEVAALPPSGATVLHQPIAVAGNWVAVSSNGENGGDGRVTLFNIPEPSTLVLVILGVFAVAGRCRTRGTD